MTDANQVRINELARELEVKAKAIIDLLPRLRRHGKEDALELDPCGRPLRKCARTFREAAEAKRKWSGSQSGKKSEGRGCEGRADEACCACRTTPSQRRATVAVKPSAPAVPAAPVAKPIAPESARLLLQQHPGAGSRTCSGAASRHACRTRTPAPAATPIRRLRLQERQATLLRQRRDRPYQARPAAPSSKTAFRHASCSRRARRCSRTAPARRQDQALRLGHCHRKSRSDAYGQSWAFARYVAGSRASGPRPGSRCALSNRAKDGPSHLDPVAPAVRVGHNPDLLEQRRGPMPTGTRPGPRAPGRPGMLRFPEKLPPKAEPGKPLYTRSLPSASAPLRISASQEGERKLHPTRQASGRGPPVPPPRSSRRRSRVRRATVTITRGHHDSRTC